VTQPSQTTPQRQFDWLSLIPRIIHPIKVAIIEALLWVDQPLSASDLTKVFEQEFSLGLVAYHLKELDKVGVAKEVGHRHVRGAREKFYFFVS
jgi:hypothetical protein